MNKPLIIKKYLIAVSLLFLQFSYSHAQKSVSLRVFNDMTYFTDRYYSNGIEISFYNPQFSKSPVSFLFLPHAKNERVHWSINFTHHLYTPTDTYTTELNDKDHPYATYFLIGSAKESYSFLKQTKKTSALKIGMIGPLAGGEQFQNTMHANISIAEHVEGWQYQVANDFCLQYEMKVEKGIIGSNWLEANVILGGKLGTPHTEAEFGVHLRTGIFENYFREKDIFTGRKFQLWLFCQGDAKFIYYNAVLQGGLNNPNSPHTFDYILPLVWHLSFGGAIQYKRLKVELAQEVISPQFDGMGWHRWAYLGLSVRL